MGGRYLELHGTSAGGKGGDGMRRLKHRKNVSDSPMTDPMIWVRYLGGHWSLSSHNDDGNINLDLCSELKSPHGMEFHVIAQ